MIPDAAVEAAARHLGFYTDCPDNDWTVEARALLEAAAPHILAEAWDETMTRAAEIAWEHDASASSAITTTPNPHRPAK